MQWKPPFLRLTKRPSSSGEAGNIVTGIVDQMSVTLP